MKKQRKSKASSRSKQNDDSNDIRKWTAKKLKAEALALHDAISGENACFGCKDLIRQMQVLTELQRRDINVKIQIAFD